MNTTTIYQSNYSGKTYAGDAKGITATVVHVELALYNKGVSDGIYTEYTLKTEYRNSGSGSTVKQQVIHR